MSFEKVAGVICAGNISHDILVRPVEEFRWGTNTWVEDYQEGMGGNGSNSSFAMATLGVPVRLLGMVGPDERGDALLAKLSGAGADVSFVERSAQPTTTTIVVINRAGNRLFFQRVGSSLEAFSRPTVFSPELIRGFSHYHQANLYSLANLRRNSGAQMEAAKRAGLTTSIDTGWATDGRWVESLAPALPWSDLLFVNEEEAGMLTGESRPAAIALKLRSLGAGDILLKLGGRGCAVFRGGDEYHVPGFQVEAVDTTGAGDNFAAGFFSALQRGLGWREAAEAANAVGAMCVERVGATNGVRSWDETRLWMSKARRGGSEPL
ncbi:MAG: carbohydrate kinase family protein [Bryobacteraceae bacterium]